jgi:hypothetical protein
MHYLEVVILLRAVLSIVLTQRSCTFWQLQSEYGMNTVHSTQPHLLIGVEGDDFALRTVNPLIQLLVPYFLTYAFVYSCWFVYNNGLVWEE